MTMAGLQLDGPSRFRTTVDLHATSVTESSAMPVRPLIEWEALLSRAGFQCEASARTAEGGAVLRVTERRPAAAPALTESRARLLAPPVAPAVFVVHDLAGFNALRQTGARRASWSFMVITTAGPDLVAAVAAWCRTRGIVHASAPALSDVPWREVPDGWTFVDRTGALAVAAARRGFAVQLTGDRRCFRLALFGASSRGLERAAVLRRNLHFQLVCFLDNDPAKWGTALDGTPIQPPDAPTLAAIDLIVISSMYEAAIAAQLLALEQGSRLLRDPGDVDALASLEIDADGILRSRKADSIHG